MVTPATNLVYVILRDGDPRLRIAEIQVEIDTPLFVGIEPVVRLLTDLPLRQRDIYPTLDDAILARRKLLKNEIAQCEEALSLVPVLKVDGTLETCHDVFGTACEDTTSDISGGCFCCCGHDDIDELLGFRRGSEQDGC
jgi:hypothetical protein